MNKLILAIALLTTVSTHAAELVIVHPNTQETMRGTILHLEDGYINFQVDEYESYWFDTLMQDGFDPLPGYELNLWLVDLVLPEETVMFSYYCTHWYWEGDLTLYCRS